MDRPTQTDVLMRVAFLTAERSTCTRLHVGALGSSDGRILTTGYNGVPRGMPHCTHPSTEVCARSIHAEANAIAFAARHGVTLLNSVFYCTDSPCYTCAGLLLNAGISELIYHREYRDSAGVTLLIEGGVKVYNLTVDEKTPDAPNPWKDYALEGITVTNNEDSRPDETRPKITAPGTGTKTEESGIQG